MSKGDFYEELGRGLFMLIIVVILLAGLLGAGASALIFWLVS